MARGGAGHGVADDRHGGVGFQFPRRRRRDRVLQHEYRDVANQRDRAARTGHGAAFSVHGKQLGPAGKRHRGKQDGRHQPRQNWLQRAIARQCAR
jgi:hypothetical protein